MIYDTHLHAVAEDRVKYPLDPRAGERGALVRPNEPETIARLMTEAGVDRGALVQFVTVYGYDNACCVDSARTDAERFVAVCSVDPFAPEAADQLGALVDNSGVRGLRLFTPAGWVEAPTWPDLPSIEPIVRRAVSLAIPIAVQLQPGQIGNLRRLALRFPKATLLLDHLAGVGGVREASPEERSALMGLPDLPNVYLKFSTMNLRPPAGPAAASDLLRDVIGRFGADRLLWGSNFPVSRGLDSPYLGLLDEARRVLTGAAATEDEQALILGDNAARLYCPPAGSKSD